MDLKARSWRKKATDRGTGSPNLCDDELHKLAHEKEELELAVKELSDKLANALSKLYLQDDLIKKHEMMVADSVAGWEDAEAKLFSLKQELEESFQERIFREERMTCLEAALEECMQQLQLVRDEQEKKIHVALTRSQVMLKEKLEETRSENAKLKKALLIMEKSAETLSAQRDRVELDFQSLASKLESSEKEVASLSYEIRLLKKEIGIRNEEREFNLKIADATQKQNLESAKKMAKLEAECQKLRVLVRRRLPGPAALPKMKCEVPIPGREGFGSLKRKPSSYPDDVMINSLKEQLLYIEEENMFLKEALCKKGDEPSIPSPANSGFKNGENSGESWALALISELEQFKRGQLTNPTRSSHVKASEITLMDDFLEVERLALVSSSEEPELNRCKEIVPSNELSPHQSEPVKSLCKLIDLLEGIKPFPAYCSSNSWPKEAEASSEFVVRVFQWKASELSGVVRKFVQTCYDLKNGESNWNAFVEDVGDALDWIMNHCFSIQDVSSMKHAMKKQFDWDENVSEYDSEFSAFINNGQPPLLQTQKHDLLLHSEAQTRAARADDCPKVSCFSEDSENRSCCSEELGANLPVNKASKKTIQDHQKEQSQMEIPQSEDPVSSPIVKTMIPIAVSNFNKRIKPQKSSLLDRMKEEDNIDREKDAAEEVFKQPQHRFVSNEVLDHLEKILMIESKEKSNGTQSLPIVSSGGRAGGGLWKKLWRRKK